MKLRLIRDSDIEMVSQQMRIFIREEATRMLSISAKSTSAVEMTDKQVASVNRCVDYFLRQRSNLLLRYFWMPRSRTIFASKNVCTRVAHASHLVLDQYISGG